MWRFAAAGGELGGAAAVKVDSCLRTNLPHVFAAGDCAEHYVRQLGHNSYMPLGPVANKQGRLVGSNILNPDNLRRFSGIDQTAVFKFFDLTIGTTGLNERQLHESKPDCATTVIDSDTRGAFPGGARLIPEQIIARLWLTPSRCQRTHLNIIEVCPRNAAARRWQNFSKRFVMIRLDTCKNSKTLMKNIF